MIKHEDSMVNMVDVALTGLDATPNIAAPLQVTMH